jgi:hypothetical protein
MTCKNDTNSILDSSDFVSNNHGTIDSTYSSIPDANEHEFRARDKQYDSISSSRTHGLSNSSNNNNDDELMSLPLPSSIIPIYRFKFTQEFMEELHQFSKIHYLDNRKDFKEAWTKWSEEEKKDLIEKEIKRLNDLGFHGDILDKMFKSARYYFRKRQEGSNSSSNSSSSKKDVDVEEKRHRHYHCCSKYFLEIMDKQIKNLLQEKDKELEDKKPSISFLHFCKDNKDLLKEEIESLFKLGFTDVKEIQYKIKKTYKNKYFSIIHK